MHRHRFAVGIGNSRSQPSELPAMRILDNPYDRPKPSRPKINPSRQYQSAPRLAMNKMRPDVIKKQPKTANKDIKLENSLPPALKSRHSRPTEISHKYDQIQSAAVKSRKTAKDKPQVVNDIVVISKHHLASMLAIDSHEESVFNIDIDLESHPSIVKIDAEPASAFNRERMYERDYLLLDMRNPDEFEACRVFDCTYALT